MYSGVYGMRNCNKLGHNFGPMQITCFRGMTYVALIQRVLS